MQDHAKAQFNLGALCYEGVGLKHVCLILLGAANYGKTLENRTTLSTVIPTGSLSLHGGHMQIS